MSVRVRHCLAVARRGRLTEEHRLGPRRLVRSRQALDFLLGRIPQAPAGGVSQGESGSGRTPDHAQGDCGTSVESPWGHPVVVQSDDALEGRAQSPGPLILPRISFPTICRAAR